MARPSRFSPRSEPHEALEERTVCREDLVASMVRGVADAVRTGQTRFELVLGPRGAGKSHLLGLIEGRLRKELEGTAIVAGPPEEFHPSSLLHLLAEILRSLPPDPESGPVERQIAILAAALADARDRAVGMIRARLRGQPLVIVIENLDVVFAAIGRDGQHQLRSILQTERRWSIVATSRSRAPAFSKESEPFFGTFILRTLEPLSGEGCRDLLVRLAHAYERDDLARELHTAKGLARVQTLRHVLGGYPRTMAFIFPHLHHDRPDAVEEALRDLAEEVTPYFQEQMSRLPPSQQPIAELLAEHWTPLSVGEISKATFTSQPATSTYLKRLREDAIVRSMKLGREQFYEISEPLFRLARAMKRDELRPRAFLRILQRWYEFRGMDMWRLPNEAVHEMRDFDWDLGEYQEQIMEASVQALRCGQGHEVIRRLDEDDLTSPAFTALRIVALAVVGEHRSSLRALTAVSQFECLQTVARVWALTRSLSGDAPCRESPAVKLCTVLGTLIVAEAGDGEKDSESQVVGELEALLTALEPELQQRTALVVLASLAHVRLLTAGEHGVCWRLISTLDVADTGALDLCLAALVARAWATERLSDVFAQKEALSKVQARLRDPLAIMGFSLAMHRGDAPTSSVNVDEARARLVEKDLVDWDRMSMCDEEWLILIATFLIELEGETPWMPVFVSWVRTLSFNARAAAAMAAQLGVIRWIALGRDLAPISSPRIEELGESLGFLARTWSGMPHDPDAAYVRLSEAERSLVRSFAERLGFLERHRKLCELSNES